MAKQRVKIQHMFEGTAYISYVDPKNVEKTVTSLKQLGHTQIYVEEYKEDMYEHAIVLFTEGR